MGNQAALHLDADAFILVEKVQWHTNGDLLPSTDPLKIDMQDAIASRMSLQVLEDGLLFVLSYADSQNPRVKRLLVLCALQVPMAYLHGKGLNIAIDNRWHHVGGAPQATRRRAPRSHAVLR